MLALLGTCALAIGSAFAATTNLTYPSSFKSNNLVYSNFFGISIELSIINTLIGNNVSTIPPQIGNYLANIQARAKKPLRLRIGGNSMDDSIFNASQPEMVTFTTPAANVNDQPVTYGPTLYDVLAEVGNRAGGAQYLIGVSLILYTENKEDQIVSIAETKLGTQLDAFTLGNEPDLYAGHQKRPANYSQTDYFAEFANVSKQINSSTTYRDLAPRPIFAGPTICCAWNLIDLLKLGYLEEFGTELKYLNLQHYPQNNCGGHPTNPIDYYLRHYEVINLAQWQIDGVQAAHNASIPITMGEFNSASCGGIPGVSDTFGLTMWGIDYALQLASVGYAGAYIHTRERGVTYNLFDPPASNSSSQNWTTNSMYYSLLPVAEALSETGSYVTDLNLNGNANTSVVAGYGVYDGSSGAPKSFVLFNYAEVGNEAATFNVPSLGGKHTLLVRTLTAAGIRETSNITWAGRTFNGVGDGKAVDSGYAPDQKIQCDSGCSFDIPSPGVAVVWLDTADAQAEPNPTGTSSASQGSTSANAKSGGGNNTSGASSLFTLSYFSIFSWTFMISLGGLL